MSSQNHKVQFIILAGGKGTRMNNGKPSKTPKALYPLAKVPMISYILATLKKMDIKNPIIVVGYQANQIIKFLGPKYLYAYQKQRLGTGHAAKIGLKKVRDDFKDVFILNSDDSAFYTAKTLCDVIKRHQSKNAILSFLTVKIPGLTDYGRIIRDGNGEVRGVVEKDNMTNEQKKLDEINCAAYLVNLQWLKKNINKISQNYKGGKEYPLPDIIKIALKGGEKVLGITIDAREWVGINTKKQLQQAEKLIK